MSEFCSRSFQTPIRSPAPIPEKGDAEREVVAGLSIKLLQRGDELGIQMFQRHSLRHHGFTFVGNFFGFPVLRPDPYTSSPKVLSNSVNSSLRGSRSLVTSAMLTTSSKASMPEISVLSIMTSSGRSLVEIDEEI